jgi:hypothetical protein
MAEAVTFYLVTRERRGNSNVAVRRPGRVRFRSIPAILESFALLTTVASGRDQRPVQKQRNADHVGPPVLYSVPAGGQAQPDCADGHHHRGDCHKSVTQIDRAPGAQAAHPPRHAIVGGCTQPMGTRPGP